MANYFGLDFDLFLLCWAGNLVHICLKFIYSFDKAQREKTVFYKVNWIKDNLAYILMSFVASTLILIVASEKWLPLDYFKSVACGLCGAVLVLYLYPVITNPTLYKNIFNRYFPNDKKEI